MDSKCNDMINILDLEDGEELYFNMCNEGGALVERKGEEYHLYEVPLYGGEPRYMQTFGPLDVYKLVDVAYSWT